MIYFLDYFSHINEVHLINYALNVIISLTNELKFTACGNPTSWLALKNQQLKSGQSTVFPANMSSIFIIECQLSYFWADGDAEKNLTCVQYMWIPGNLESCLLSIF